MKKCMFILLFVISFSVNANDYSRGVDAYDSGNYQEAFKWFEKSAIQGNASAQFTLAMMYDSGEGVKQNKKEAFEWFKKSAEQHFAIAQYSLAVMYCSGTGVFKNTKKCIYWAQKADVNGIDVKELWEYYELWKYKE